MRLLGRVSAGNGQSFIFCFLCFSRLPADCLPYYNNIRARIIHARYTFSFATAILYTSSLFMAAIYSFPKRINRRRHHHFLSIAGYLRVFFFPYIRNHRRPDTSTAGQPPPHQRVNTYAERFRNNFKLLVINLPDQWRRKTENFPRNPGKSPYIVSRIEIAYSKRRRLD